MHSIFNQLSVEELNLLDACRQEKEIKSGEIIFREGSYPKGIYCVGIGKIKVTKEEVLGHEHILYLAGRGDIMGYRAILAEDTFSCSAAAIENSRICFIPKSVFYTLLETNPRLSLRLAQLMAVELKKAETKVTGHTHPPAKSRIASGLKWLCETYGMEGNTINAALKRTDLANLAGTTRETATRILYDLQSEGIIELKGRFISIVNSPKLYQLTSSHR